MEVLKDINGKASSKRKIGILFCKATLGFGLLHYFLTVALKIAFGLGLIVKIDIPFPTQIWLGFLGVGTSMLGVTVFESIKSLK